MITNIEDYFSKGCGRCERFATPECSTRRWIEGLNELRAICLDLGLIETVKWAHPCYMHHGRNIAGLGAFRGDFRIRFFDAALMKDPESVLTKQGPNTQHPDMISFSANAEVIAMKTTVRSYLLELMEYAEAGVRMQKAPAKDLQLPLELVEAMDADTELAESFLALTPGRQRSYVINLNSAKKSETRVARIGKFRPKILAGKGALER